MDDTTNCPICGRKMRIVNLYGKMLHNVNKQADYTERTCVQSATHLLQFFADKTTGKVDFINLSLDPKNSKYLEIDFVNEKCRISCMKDGVPEYIEIPKMIVPDFPQLEKLKEKVNLFVVFS